MDTNALLNDFELQWNSKGITKEKIESELLTKYLDKKWIIRAVNDKEIDDIKKIKV